MKSSLIFGCQVLPLADGINSTPKSSLSRFIYPLIPNNLSSSLSFEKITLFFFFE